MNAENPDVVSAGIGKLILREPRSNWIEGSSALIAGSGFPVSGVTIRRSTTLTVRSYGALRLSVKPAREPEVATEGPLI